MATIVTAYYLFHSKFPPAQYLDWIQNFLKNVNCQLIFFTTADRIPQFQEIRSANSFANSTLFVDHPISNWTAFQKYGRKFWEDQKLLDPEAQIHSPELYAIWYEKKEFVAKAIQLNPFSTDKFIWCDAGCFRNLAWFPRVSTFGQFDQIPEDRLMLLQIQPFTSAEKDSKGLRNFERVNRIGGGIQAGSKATWEKWRILYDQQLEKYVQANKFMGKDQNILAELVLNFPDQVQIVPPSREISDPWFTLLATLSKVKPIQPLVSILIPLYNGIEYLTETCESVAAQTYTSWEVLIGVNGHSKNSPVYQQAQEICQKILEKNEYRVFDFNEIRGKPETMNKLAEESKGSWLALLDADDLWTPHKLMIQSQYFDKYDVIGTRCVYFQNSSGSPNIPLGDISSIDFWRTNPLLNSTVVLKKICIQEIPWNSTNEWNLDDYELWLNLRYGRKGTKFWNCPEICMKHRIYPTSSFNSTNSLNLPAFLAAMKKKLIG